jgi:hypothetical protein
MNPQRPSLFEIVLKTLVTHTVTYFFLGVVSFVLLDYATVYSSPGVAGFLRPTSDRLVAAGPLFQPIRGLLLGLVLFLLREPIFRRKHGWLVLWATLVVIGILSPYVAAPGSLEGLIYTTVPLSFHLTSLPEVILQTLLFAVLLFYWVNNPQKRWLSWILGISFILVLFFPALGLLFPQAQSGAAPTPTAQPLARGNLAGPGVEVGPNLALGWLGGRAGGR